MYELTCCHVPQVDAVVLKLTPLARPEITAEYRTFEAMVKALFQFRRKYIRRGARCAKPGSLVSGLPIHHSVVVSWFCTFQVTLSSLSCCIIVQIDQCGNCSKMYSRHGSVS